MPKVTFNKTPVTICTEQLQPIRSSSTRKPKRSILKRKHPLTGIVPRKQRDEWERETVGDYIMFKRKNRTICTRKGRVVAITEDEVIDFI